MIDTPCASCGSDRRVVQVTASSVDADPTIEAGVVLVPRVLLDDPDGVQVEIACGVCGNAHYLASDLWEWA
jgi:hypothetical protein